MSNSSAVVLLAAGSSSRMGTPKQLLDFRGEPLLRHAVCIAEHSGCSPIVVVLGSHEDECRSVLTGLPVEIVVNPRWKGGMGTSIQCGLRALGPAVDGAILALADQPFVTSEYLRGLVTRHHETGKRIVASRYANTVGVPVFFARPSFPLLFALEPDRGCKPVILDNSADASFVDCPEAAVDIDTPDDYANICRAHPGGVQGY